MKIETKYNTGDVVITITAYGYDVVRVESVNINIKDGRPSISYYVVDDDDMGYERKESLLFASREELIEFVNKETDGMLERVKVGGDG